MWVRTKAVVWRPAYSQCVSTKVVLHSCILCVCVWKYIPNHDETLQVYYRHKTKTWKTRGAFLLWRLPPMARVFGYFAFVFRMLSFYILISIRRCNFNCVANRSSLTLFYQYFEQPRGGEAANQDGNIWARAFLNLAAENAITLCQQTQFLTPHFNANYVQSLCVLTRLS
jgi:hypothetical protein